MNKSLYLYRKVILIFVGILLAFLFLILLDRFLGIHLNKIGYFKAMYPGITEVYNTSEFKAEVNISSQGLRNKEVEVPKPNNKYRVLALGDSFTFGWGVNLEDSWVKLLEKQINVKDKEIEIVVGGVPGAGLKEITHICQAYKDYLGADAFIITLFTDDLHQSLLEETSPSLISKLLEKSIPTLTRIYRPVIKYNLTGKVKNGATLESTFYWKKVTERNLKSNPNLSETLNEKIKSLYLQGMINPAMIQAAYNYPEFLVYLLDRKELNLVMTSFEKQFDTFKKECVKDKLSIIVYLPSEEFISKQYLDAKQGLGYIIDDNLLTFDLDVQIKKVSDKKSFELISLLENFRRDGCPNCYYPYDGHLTKDGNIRVAEFIKDKIQVWLDNHYDEGN